MATDKMTIKVRVDGADAAKAQLGKVDATIGSMVATIGSAVAALMVFKKALDFGRETLNVAGQFEQWEIAFETMLGSAEKAKIMMSDLFDFAASTPFQIPDLVANSKRLMGMGIESEKVIDTMRILGDVAAGVGVPIERLALNFGQVKAQAKLTGRELRDFAVAGVPLMGELAKSLGVSETEIQNMVSAGQIGFQDVENAFRAMSSEGGKFYNLMARQNKSFLGQMSNLKDQWTQLENAIGEAMLPLVQKYLPEAIDSINYLISQIKGINRVYKSQSEIINELKGLTKEQVQEELERYKALVGSEQEYQDELNKRSSEIETIREQEAFNLKSALDGSLKKLKAEQEAAIKDVGYSEDRVKHIQNTIKWIEKYIEKLKDIPPVTLILIKPDLEEPDVDLEMPDLLENMDDIIAANNEAIAKSIKENLKMLKAKSDATANEIQEKWQQTGDIMGNVFYEAFGGQFDNIEEMFKNMLKRMLADFAASGLISLLSGGASGGIGFFGAGGLLSGLFGGADNAINNNINVQPTPVVINFDPIQVSRSAETGDILRGA